MNPLFYEIRHLKDFKKLSGNNDSVWCWRWPDGASKVEIYCKGAKKGLFNVDNVHLAQYICDLHNLSGSMINHLESVDDKSI